MGNRRSHTNKNKKQRKNKSIKASVGNRPDQLVKKRSTDQSEPLAEAGSGASFLLSDCKTGDDDEGEKGVVLAIVVVAVAHEEVMMSFRNCCAPSII